MHTRSKFQNLQRFTGISFSHSLGPAIPRSLVWGSCQNGWIGRARSARWENCAILVCWGAHKAGDVYLRETGTRFNWKICKNYLEDLKCTPACVPCKTQIWATKATSKMLVAVGPYGQSQPSCFDRMKMSFVMDCSMGMAAGALFGTFSYLRMGMWGWELMGSIGKTMMQSDGTFGTFMAIGMGIWC